MVMVVVVAVVVAVVVLMVSDVMKAMRVQTLL